MSSTIIDETVILRYLLNDDEVLSPRAAKVIATRTARVYPEIITRVVVTLRDVYKVPRVEIATAMTKLLDDVMVDEPTVIALANGKRCALMQSDTKQRTGTYNVVLRGVFIKILKRCQRSRNFLYFIKNQ